MIVITHHALVDLVLFLLIILFKKRKEKHSAVNMDENRLSVWFFHTRLAHITDWREIRVLLNPLMSINEY